MREELLKGLTEEQVKRVKACKNSEELLAAAKEEGIVAGGGYTLLQAQEYLKDKL